MYRTSEDFAMPNNQGFTLIEMMIALTIAAILITVGIPSYFDMIQRNSVSTASNELVGALLYARSEAVRQEVNVTFTSENDGWIVEADTDGDGINDLTLLEYDIDNSKISIAEDITADDTITYNSRGRASASAGDSFDISFDDTLEARICLTLIGRPYIKKVADGDCP
jgi:type IV fimbrial biogenesis protein FimT